MCRTFYGGNMANDRMFRVGDMVSVCIPVDDYRGMDPDVLYRRFGLFKSIPYIIYAVDLAAYSRKSDTNYWRYVLKDGPPSYIPERWLCRYEEDEDIRISDIKYLLGD